MSSRASSAVNLPTDRRSRCQGGRQGTVSPEEDVHTVHVARVESYGVAGLGVHVLVREEVVGHLRRPRHLAGPLETQHQEIQHQSIVLDYERRKLQSSYYPIRIGVVHILHTQGGKASHTDHSMDKLAEIIRKMQPLK